MDGTHSLTVDSNIRWLVTARTCSDNLQPAGRYYATIKVIVSPYVQDIKVGIMVEQVGIIDLANVIVGRQDMIDALVQSAVFGLQLVQASIETVDNGRRVLQKQPSIQAEVVLR